MDFYFFKKINKKREGGNEGNKNKKKHDIVNHK